MQTTNTKVAAATALLLSLAGCSYIATFPAPTGPGGNEPITGWKVLRIGMTETEFLRIKGLPATSTTPQPSEPVLPAFSLDPAIPPEAIRASLFWGFDTDENPEGLPLSDLRKLRTITYRITARPGVNFDPESFFVNALVPELDRRFARWAYGKIDSQPEWRDRKTGNRIVGMCNKFGSDPLVCWIKIGSITTPL